MKSLGIILSRKNSKRLKKKNLLKIGNKTLIEKTIISAVKSKCFEKIIVSSDDLKIKSIVKKYSRKVDFHFRPSSLAQDNTKAIEVVIFLLKMFSNYDTVSLLLPTCPFRTSQDIQKAFKIFNKNYKNTLSVTDYDFPPEFALKKKGGFYSPIKDSPLLKNKTRSQEFISSLRPNGAIYISLVSNLFKNKNFYVKEMNIYKMSKIKSIDIDTKLDFELAKLIYKKYEKK